MATESSTDHLASGSEPIEIFISYRRDDASGQALMLRKDLAARFGPDHVFMDVTDLRAGVNFVKVIRDHVSRCGILIALIGRQWLATLDDRTKSSALDHTEDYVRLELETALQRNSRIWVLPVVLDDAVMPSSERLPRPLKRLSELSAATLRHTRWDDDVLALIDRIEELAREVNEANEPDPAPEPQVEARPRIVDERNAASMPDPGHPPDPGHYENVARLIVRDNTVIPFLGSVLHAGERSDVWSEACGSLPDGDELAAHLAREFEYGGGEPADLAEISQYVLLTMGRVDLYRTLRRVLTANCNPASVHRFLAALPAALEALGRPNRYQLIVTTNYDDALERAFDEANEPYDLAVYMAHAEHKGKFLHVPFSGDPQLIAVPNTYLDFPIDDDGELGRTIILKIHGAVDNARGPHPCRENYVTTENDYIDYLSRAPIESLLPLQLLNKMRESHCLFLGYRVRDWNLRVFLQRVWGEQRLGAQSWAIADRADRVEKRFWNDLGVDLFDVPLTTYLDELRDRLAARERAEAQP